MDGFSEFHGPTQDSLPRSRAARMVRLLEGASIEIAPRQIADGVPVAGEGDRVAEVFVPFLPGADFDQSLDACAHLSQRGFTPVPHLPARAVPDHETLARFLDGLAARNVTRILLIAGDAPRPAGPFTDTLQLIDTPALNGTGLTGLCVAGHPEGHPHADEAALMAALRRKQAHARAHGLSLTIVTQFSFDAAPVIAWAQRLAAEGIEAPVRIGIPAPVGMGTLLRFAMRCGVGASARLLGRRPDALQLLKRFDPLPLIAAFAGTDGANPPANLAGLHLYCFGGAAQALSWRAQALDDLRATAQRETAHAEDAAP
ncbi:MAG: methylenetetrahydrofolate reductase [Salinarimonas sp.]